MKKYIGAIIVLIAIVSILVFTSKPANTARVSWQPNTEADVAGYKIYYGPAPRNADCPEGGYPDKVDVQKSASHTFSDLTPGKFYFSITSYDQSGNESCFSPEVAKEIKANNIFASLKIKILKLIM